MIQELAALRASVAACDAVVLEFGNTAQPQGAARTLFTSFVRQLKFGGGGGGGGKARAVARVTFNINPDYAKPTATVTAPDRDGAFRFAYAMGRPFPCVMVVHLHADCSLPPLRLDFDVCETDTSRRLILMVPKAKLRPGSQAVAVEARPPRNARIVFADRQATCMWCDRLDQDGAA